MFLWIFQLQNKLALVTGSTAGIGYAIAEGLAREGATVIVNGRTALRLAVGSDLRADRQHWFSRTYDLSVRTGRLGDATLSSLNPVGGLIRGRFFIFGVASQRDNENKILVLIRITAKPIAP